MTVEVTVSMLSRWREAGCGGSEERSADAGTHCRSRSTRVSTRSPASGCSDRAGPQCGTAGKDLRAGTGRVSRRAARCRRCCGDGEPAVDHRTAAELDCRELRHKRRRGRPGLEAHNCAKAGCVIVQCPSHRCTPMSASSIRQVHRIISAALAAALLLRDLGPLLADLLGEEVVQRCTNAQAAPTKITSAPVASTSRTSRPTASRSRDSGSSSSATATGTPIPPALEQQRQHRHPPDVRRGRARPGRAALSADARTSREAPSSTDARAIQRRSACDHLRRALLELPVGPAHLAQGLGVAALGQLEQRPLLHPLRALGEQFPVQGDAGGDAVDVAQVG
jgi:hypothetical protein